MIDFPLIKQSLVGTTVILAQVVLAYGIRYQDSYHDDVDLLGLTALGILAADLSLMGIATVAARQGSWRLRTLKGWLATAAVGALTHSIWEMRGSDVIYSVTIASWCWFAAVVVTVPILRWRERRRATPWVWRFRVGDMIGISTVVALLVAWHVQFEAGELFFVFALPLLWFTAVHSVSIGIAWWKCPQLLKWIVVLALPLVGCEVLSRLLAWSGEDTIYVALPTMLHSALVLLWTLTFFPRAGEAFADV